MIMKQVCVLSVKLNGQNSDSKTGKIVDKELQEGWSYLSEFYGASKHFFVSKTWIAKTPNSVTVETKLLSEFTPRN